MIATIASTLTLAAWVVTCILITREQMKIEKQQRDIQCKFYTIQEEMDYVRRLFEAFLSKIHSVEPVEEKDEKPTDTATATSSDNNHPAKDEAQADVLIQFCGSKVWAYKEEVDALVAMAKESGNFATVAEDFAKTVCLFTEVPNYWDVKPCFDVAKCIYDDGHMWQSDLDELAHAGLDIEEELMETTHSKGKQELVDKLVCQGVTAQMFITACAKKWDKVKNQEPAKE